MLDNSIRKGDSRGLLRGEAVIADACAGQPTVPVGDAVGRDGISNRSLATQGVMAGLLILVEERGLALLVLAT